MSSRRGRPLRGTGVLPGLDAVVPRPVVLGSSVLGSLVVGSVILGAAVLGCAPSDHGRHAHGFPPPPRARVEVPGAERWAAELATRPVRLEAAGERGIAVATRSDQLLQAPCRRCHEKPLEEARIAHELPERAHWQIERAHGTALDLSCATCHETPTTMELRDLRGEPVDFDHSYRLCATCHFQQAEDWVGGAHGKRLAAWAGERVIESCTGCHDPHEPAFAPRLPSTHAPSPLRGRS